MPRRAKMPRRETPHSITLVGKAAELLVLGLIIGLFSLVISPLWAGYTYKASDLIQYLTTERFPNFFLERLPFQLILIDIGDTTCDEWAMDNQRLCAALPRLPHDKLLEIFKSLAKSKPKLVVVDIDLRSEAVHADPLNPNVDSFTDAEKDIRDAIKTMRETPFLVAEPLIRNPKKDQRQYYDYVAIGTILHKLDKPNLRFGQVEQDFADDRVQRRFPVTEEILYPDLIINANSSDPSRFPHLAVQVCELVTDESLCGRDVTKKRESAEGNERPRSPLRFGAMKVDLNDHIQFRYLIARDLGRLANLGVRQIEARAIPDSNFEDSELRDAVVIVGSTARGRGDYHFTPLDVLGGETSGVVVVANEVVAALENRWLVSPSVLTVIWEKLTLIVLSTGVIFYMFWYPRLRRTRPASAQSFSRRLLSAWLLAIHFVLVGRSSSYDQCGPRRTYMVPRIRPR
jgi:CHASE2 domain-containing sensor protein